MSTQLPALSQIREENEWYHIISVETQLIHKSFAQSIEAIWEFENHIFSGFFFKSQGLRKKKIWKHLEAPANFSKKIQYNSLPLKPMQLYKCLTLPWIML